MDLDLEFQESVAEVREERVMAFRCYLAAEERRRGAVAGRSNSYFPSLSFYEISWNDRIDLFLVAKHRRELYNF